jgi:hypothetical protein
MSLWSGVVLLVTLVEFIFVRLLVRRRPTWSGVWPVSKSVGLELPACALDSTHSGVAVAWLYW